MEEKTHQYLNEKEVSGITRRALSTLRNERFRRCGIPYIKVGRSVRSRMRGKQAKFQMPRVMEWLEVEAKYKSREDKSKC